MARAFVFAALVSVALVACNSGNASPPPVPTGSALPRPRFNGTITQFPTGGVTSPWSITSGPDGNLWFTELPGGGVGRMTPSGVTTIFTSGIPFGTELNEIVAGPDGNLWFTESGHIGRITLGGVVTTFSPKFTGGIGEPDNSGIAVGSDGNLWFTEYLFDRIGRITPAGVFTDFGTGITPGAHPLEIAAGPDGNLWFTEGYAGRIGRITPSGAITEFGGIGRFASPDNIVAGPDGNLWFTEFDRNRVVRITPGGIMTEFGADLPTLAEPQGITVGPDGNIWFTLPGSGRIGRLQ